MKKTLYIAIPIFIFLIFISQIDVELSNDATALMDRLEADSANEPYYFLLGMFAAEDENPIDVGKDLYFQYKNLEDDASYEITEYPNSNKIPLPNGKEFCAMWEDECLENVFLSSINTDELMRRNKTLLQRSNEFLNYNQFKTLTKPTLHEIYPEYQYITKTERVKVLNAISTYKKGNAQEAVDSLFSQIAKLRKALELQDSLIGKIIFLMMTSEIIDVASVILSQENIEVEKIPRLSLSERSFYLVAAREFGLSFYGYKNLDKHPEFFEMGGNFPGWITRIVFKPNMTINAITPLYYRVDYLASLSPSEFAHEIEHGEVPKLSTSKIRNYMGGVLIGVSPEFESYVARFFDLDVKIALFNQIYSLGLPPTQLQNPYYGNELPEEKNGSLCFSGPLEDRRSLRCLKIKI